MAAATATGTLIVGAPSTSPEPSESPTGSPVGSSARLVHFDAGHGLPSVSTVLRSKADVAEFLRFFSEGSGGGDDPDDGDDGDPRGQVVASKLAGIDFRRSALIVVSGSDGCAVPYGAMLTRSSEFNYRVEFQSGPDPEECYVAYQGMAIFELPADRVPPTVRLEDRAPDQPGPVPTPYSPTPP